MDFEYTTQRPVWARSADQSLMYNRRMESPMDSLFTNRSGSNITPPWMLDARQVRSQPSSSQIEGIKQQHDTRGRRETKNIASLETASKDSPEKINFLLRCVKSAGNTVNLTQIMSNANS